ncbi:MAG: hypothetical protein JWL62_2652, partial [Hyphomicrobiales bacterium]|nr:hypothetical protein [Hyphomicrobiales bacterium]
MRAGEARVQDTVAIKDGLAVEAVAPARSDPSARVSLGEHNASVPVPAIASNLKKFLAFAGP